MSKLIIFIIIMGIALLLGGVASGIYVAVIRNREEQDGVKPEDRTNIAPVVSFIMITVVLLGLIIYGIYYLLTLEPEKMDCPPCAKCARCLLSEDDFADLRKAEQVITDFQEKASYVPDVAVQEVCSKRRPGVAGKSCGNFFKRENQSDPVIPDVPRVPINTPKPASHDRCAGPAGPMHRFQRREGFRPRVGSRLGSPGIGGSFQNI